MVVESRALEPVPMMSANFRIKSWFSVLLTCGDPVPDFSRALTFAVRFSTLELCCKQSFAAVTTLERSFPLILIFPRPEDVKTMSLSPAASKVICPSFVMILGLETI